MSERSADVCLCGTVSLARLDEWDNSLVARDPKETPAFKYISWAAGDDPNNLIRLRKERSPRIGWSDLKIVFERVFAIRDYVALAAGWGAQC